MELNLLVLILLSFDDVFDRISTKNYIFLTSMERFSKNKLLGKNDIFFWLRKINFGKTVLFNSDFPLTLEKNTFFSIEFVVEQVLRKNRCFFDLKMMKSVLFSSIIMFFSPLKIDFHDLRWIHIGQKILNFEHLEIAMISVCELRTNFDLWQLKINHENSSKSQKLKRICLKSVESTNISRHFIDL